MPRNSLEGSSDRTTRPEKPEELQYDWIKITRKKQEEEPFVDAGEAFEEGMKEDEKFIDANKVFKMGMKEEVPFVDAGKVFTRESRRDADIATSDAHDSDEDEGYVDIGKKHEDAEKVDRIEEQQKEAKNMIKQIEKLRRRQRYQQINVTEED